MIEKELFDDITVKTIRDLIQMVGADPETFDAELVTQMVQTSLRILIEGHETGQLKLMNRSLKEMRYAYRIFNKYTGKKRISIFGSARTPEDHPDYIAAKEFGYEIYKHGWMIITGAANGIMKAGLEMLPSESSFGLSIRLPFEDTVNVLLEGDPKLISFRYFFIRKLMFVSHSDALAAFPGGVGTLDEVFEVLTLMQTGKGNIIPVVLLEGKNGNYWSNWQNYIDHNLLSRGWINPEDRNFWYLAKSPQDGVEHIAQFYKNFHSYRYVKDLLVIRIKTPLTQLEISDLNQQFSSLVASGKIYQSEALKEENDFCELTRIVFHHTRKNFGLVRKLIDTINSF